MDWSSPDKTKWPSTAQDALKECDKVAFPNIYRILQLLAVFPVTTSESERTFSALKRLKTYLRSTMTEDRLNGLALMYIHRDIQVSIEECVETFSRKYPTKMKLRIS